MVGVGLAFVPECKVVLGQTDKPQDEPGAMPPVPAYPKYVSNHFYRPTGYESVARTSRDFSAHCVHGRQFSPSSFKNKALKCSRTRRKAFRHIPNILEFFPQAFGAEQAVVSSAAISIIEASIK